MGQHLRLYASKGLTADQVEAWCNARANEYTELPSAKDQPIVDQVFKEMWAIRDKGDCLWHWSNWWAVRAFDFLVWGAFLCDEVLIQRAVDAASAAAKTNIGASYPGYDFANDATIKFLREHIGYVVWGDNTGI